MLSETQEMEFQGIFTIRGKDPFLKSLNTIIKSAEYKNGFIALSMLIIYHQEEFMQFVEQKGKLRSLTSAEVRDSQLNFKAYRYSLAKDILAHR